MLDINTLTVNTNTLVTKGKYKTSNTVGNNDAVIVVPVFVDQNNKIVFGDFLRQLNNNCGGYISRRLDQETDFSGKKDSVLVMQPALPQAKSIVLVGMGGLSDKKVDLAIIENIGGNAAAEIKKLRPVNIKLVFDDKFVDADMAASFVLGFRLRYSEWSKKTDSAKTTPHASLFVISSDKMRNREKLDAISSSGTNAILESVFVARQMVNQRACDFNTVEMVSRVENLCQSSRQVGITVLNEDALRKYGMNGILAVGGASPNRPYVVCIHYEGDPERKTTLALLGKTLMYDTGGLSMKPTDGMIDMHIDMAGGAAVFGAMQLLVAQQAKVNVMGVLGIAENVTGSKSYRPGDIITMMSGKTVEVGNTDAEGRLVLADCLSLIQRETGMKIDKIIEASTLTGAALVALHDQYAGLMTRDDGLARLMLNVAAQTNEPLWRLPMGDAFAAMLKSPSGQADLGNIGTPARMGGASVAAEFLQQFISPKVRFVHLDIAPTAWLNSGRGIYPSGATGYGVRLIAETVMRLAKQR